jgi:hypothetical protein
MVVRPSDWWNQPLLETSSVLLIGCGAVGNEVAKNMVLLGTMNITIIDFDKIEEHNLSRTVLFNEHSKKQSNSNFKVDVMKVGLEALIPNVRVTARRTGILDDLSRRSERWRRWDEPYIDREELIELGLRHEICIIATDGVAPKAFINKHLYSVIPIVQIAMSDRGGTVRIRVSLPGITSCIMCPSDKNKIQLKDDGTPDWDILDRLTGSTDCKIQAQVAGAASFTHTNALAGAYGSSQCVAIIMGWSSFRDSGFQSWPFPTPLPLWNEISWSKPMHPGGPRTSKITDYDSVAFELDSRGKPLCYNCRHSLAEKIFLANDVAERVEIKPLFEDAFDAPRVKNNRGISKPTRSSSLGKMEE